MAKWFDVRDTKVLSVQKGGFPNCFILFLTGKFQNEEYNHEIRIAEGDFDKQIEEFLNGGRLRCYFSFGMQDIDVYKTGDKIYAITHSPIEGLNIRFLFAQGEFEKLLH